MGETIKRLCLNFFQIAQTLIRSQQQTYPQDVQLLARKAIVKAIHMSKHAVKLHVSRFKDV